MRKRNEEVGLDNVFFDRIVGDALDIAGKIERDAMSLSESCRQLAYIEGRMSVVYQIYASRVYNPRLLERSSAALDRIREIFKSVVSGANVDKMKKPELVELCGKIGIDTTGMTLSELREEVKKFLKEQTR